MDIRKGSTIIVRQQILLDNARCLRDQQRSFPNRKCGEQQIKLKEENVNVKL